MMVLPRPISVLVVSLHRIRRMLMTDHLPRYHLEVSCWLSGTPAIARQLGFTSAIVNITEVEQLTVRIVKEGLVFCIDINDSIFARKGVSGLTCDLRVGFYLRSSEDHPLFPEGMHRELFPSVINCSFLMRHPPQSLLLVGPVWGISINESGTPGKFVRYSP